MPFRVEAATTLPAFPAMSHGIHEQDPLLNVRTYTPYIKRNTSLAGHLPTVEPLGVMIAPTRSQMYATQFTIMQSVRSHQIFLRLERGHTPHTLPRANVEKRINSSL